VVDSLQTQETKRQISLDQQEFLVQTTQVFKHLMRHLSTSSGKSLPHVVPEASLASKESSKFSTTTTTALSKFKSFGKGYATLSST
jgi:hypothetical protein